MYSKEFTRDFSIIMEEIWHQALFLDIPAILNLPSLKKSPLVFYYSRDVIEVWSDPKIIMKLLDKIDIEAKKNPAKFQKILDDYEKQLRDFKPFFKIGPTLSRKRLLEFIDRLFQIITPFTLMYYIAETSLGPKSLQLRAKKLREKDSFYEDSDRYLRRSLRKIYSQSQAHVSALTSQDLDRTISSAALARRWRNFIFIPNQFLFSGNIHDFAAHHPEFKFLSPRFKKEAQVIKGQIGFPGLVQGKVRVVRRKADIKNVRPKEILVSPMTTPDYLSAMKIAAAFVTDEGGLLCHAAIIAREMKKPCVIGTKIATQVLRGGDLVEVDAGKGIIKILTSKIKK